jgi:opacity protein-like surface antigen
MRMIAIAATIVALSGVAASADPLQDEIAYLIGFVRHSSCTFIRNGTEYSGTEAADHVQAKYDYYKDDIKTVEDFIERAASKSVLSGKPYEVRCDGKTMPAADWIRAEDSAYRSRQSGN